MPEPTTPVPAPPAEAAAAVDESTANGAETPEPGAEALGDAGKKALDSMKAKWKAAEEKVRAADERVAAAEAKIAGKEAEYAAEQEKRKVEDAALAKANERILKAEIRAVAAASLADPKDALLYLDLAKFEVGDDGEVDTDAVKAAIEDLVKAKPYLAAQGGNTGTTFESPGAHRKGAPAGQLSQADLKSMTPAQIKTARAEGRFSDLFGIKP